MIAGSLEIQLLANVARLQQDMDKGVSIVSGATRKIESAVSATKTVLASLGAGLTVGYFASLIKGSIDALDNLRDLSKTTNIAIEDLSGLKLAAKQSGGDLEGLAGAINKLGQNIGKDAEKYKTLGITAKEPLEAFKQLSDVFIAIRDPQQRAAVMADALGKSWQSAAPLLSEGSKRIQEMVDKGKQLSGVTKEAADQADEFNDQLEEMKINSEAIGISIASSMLPALNRALQAFRDSTEQGETMLGVWRAIRAFGKMDEQQWNMRQMVEISGKIFELETAMAQMRKDNIPAADREELVALKAKYAAHKAIVDAMERENNLGGKPKPSGNVPNTKAFLDNDGEARRKKEQAEAIRVYNLVEADRQRLAEEGAELAIYVAKIENDKQAEREALIKKGIASEEAAAIARHNIREQEYIEEGQRALKRLNDEKEKLKELNEFTLQAARNMQNAMGTFFFDFMEGRMQGLTQSFISMINRMVAEALAAKLGQYLFGDYGKTNEIGGVVGPLLSSAMGFFGGGASGGASSLAAADLAQFGIPAYADGTPSVPRTGLALVHKGEEIIPAGQSRTVTVKNYFTVNGQTDARSQSQIAAAAGQGVQRAIARNT